MDAIAGGGEALLAPSGDYVLLAPSGDYDQSIPPKSTNRIRCFTSRTVLLPTPAKLTRGIWEINRGKILVLTVTVFKNIQEHSMKFKNIRGYSNGKIKFKNIQDFRRPVRTLPPMYLRPAVTLHGSVAGVTATFVTALVSMDCINAFHHVVGV